jgi:hypothetical protein
MKRRYPAAWVGGIILITVILISLLVAPISKINSGSTYNNSPDGYGAWYAFMQHQGISIQRWQKPFQDLQTQKGMATLVQITSKPNPPELPRIQREWVEKGNTLVILGVQASVTAANFHTQQYSSLGKILIDTTRRHLMDSEVRVALGDRFGGIVWEETYGEGRVFFATTPYLAANAYQGYGNFAYLAKLVSNHQNQVWVDEYIHGYKDQEVKEKEGKGDLLDYLSKTPLSLTLLPGLVFLVVLIRAENRRFGKPVDLDTLVIDNSQAYIQALAGVLQKAKSENFVVEMLGKQEQLQLQEALGLGQAPEEDEILCTVWTEKTGTSPVELKEVLNLQKSKDRISERQLLSWLGKWKNLRKSL